VTRGAGILATLRPARASLRVTLARWLLWIATPLAGVRAARETLESSIAREPYFADPSAALGIVHLVSLARRLWPALLALALGAGLAWIVLQLLTAGALLRLERGRPERTSLWRAIWDGGSRALFPYLRIALSAALLSGLGALALARTFGWLEDHGERAGWTGKTLMRDLPLARVLLTALWISLVGVFAFWLRVLVARERRPRVRVAARGALRLCLRRPLAVLAFHWSVAVATLVVQGAVLLAWQAAAEPAPPGRWLGLWLVVLFASAYAWQWRLRAALWVLRASRSSEAHRGA
jgi:hypothetical protein